MLAAHENGGTADYFDLGGNMFFAEMQNHVVRRVDAKTHVISTVAGTGALGYNGDNRAATSAQLSSPTGLAPPME